MGPKIARRRNSAKLTVTTLVKVRVAAGERQTGILYLYLPFVIALISLSFAPLPSPLIPHSFIYFGSGGAVVRGAARVI
eukprot:scaffold63930_cov24-Tisochrysis_lutea.AAC.1